MAYESTFTGAEIDALLAGARNPVVVGNLLTLTTDSTHEEIMAALGAQTQDGLQRIIDGIAAMRPVLSAYTTANGLLVYNPVQAYMASSGLVAMRVADPVGGDMNMLGRDWHNVIVYIDGGRLKAVVSVQTVLETGQLADNLTTATEGYALDARQGKALADRLAKKPDVWTFRHADSLTTDSTEDEVYAALGVDGLSKLMTLAAGGCVFVNATSYDEPGPDETCTEWQPCTVWYSDEEGQLSVTLHGSVEIRLAFNPAGGTDKVASRSVYSPVPVDSLKSASRTAPLAARRGAELNQRLDDLESALESVYAEFLTYIQAHP